MTSFMLEMKGLKYPMAWLVTYSLERLDQFPKDRGRKVNDEGNQDKGYVASRCHVSDWASRFSGDRSDICSDGDAI
jgi:hypothetical protein